MKTAWITFEYAKIVQKNLKSMRKLNILGKDY
jgi:hypothetical protein